MPQISTKIFSKSPNKINNNSPLRIFSGGELQKLQHQRKISSGEARRSLDHKRRPLG
jgi:hypothetical protein